MPIIDPDYVPPIAITFDEGKPIRSEQGLLLAGNPIAIAQGKPGAPRLYGKAAVPRSQQTELPALTGLTVGSVGVSNLHYLGDFVSGPSSGVITSVLFSGTIRFQATQFSSIGGESGSFVKNGVVVQSWTSVFNAAAVRTVDVSVAIGDTFEWVTSNPNTDSWTNYNILANDAYTRIGIPIKVSDL